MSEVSKECRENAKKKLEKYLTKSVGQVDASDWKPEDDEDSESNQVNRKPSKSAEKNLARGGKAEGEKAKMHAGRKGRAFGGPMMQGSGSPGLEGPMMQGGKGIGGPIATPPGGGVANVPTQRFNMTGARSPALNYFKSGGRAKSAEGGKTNPSAKIDGEHP